MNIKIIYAKTDMIEFFVERENGTYNNCNLTSTLSPHEIEGLTQEQVNQLAWDKVKHIAYRVFSQIEPLNEPENFIGFEVESLPISPPAEPGPVQPNMEDFMLDLDFRLSLLELGLGV